MAEIPINKYAALHKWRLCPYGEHWVKEHALKVPSSAKNPSGYMTVRKAHCAKNRTGKDQLYADEILEIGKVHISRITPNLCHLDEFKEEGRAAQCSGHQHMLWSAMVVPQEKHCLQETQKRCNVGRGGFRV
jgi:hypothetical protein